MSKNEVAQTGGNLPANITGMAQALAQSAAISGGSSGNDLYLKFSKQGEWIYGAEETEVEEGSIWAINPDGCQHGFTAWGDDNTPQSGKNLGEVMVPATQPLPSQADLPDVEGTWAACIALQLRCTNGEDEGLQVLYKGNSKGARDVYADVLRAIVGRITDGEETFVPLALLEADSYKHAKYGKIMKPLIKIQGWADMTGEATEDKQEAVEEPEAAPKPDEEQAEKEEAPRRRRRKAS